MPGIKCKICKNDNKQNCNSHIFPEWMYKYIKNGDINNDIYMMTDDGKIISKSKGIRQHIGICTACDNKIGVYDDYMKSFVNKDFDSYYDKSTLAYFLPKEDYEYEKLKKFFISLLYRASLYKKDEFSDVDLGSRYLELCRQYLNSEITDIVDFKCVISKISSDYNEKVENIILPIGRNRDKDGVNEYIIFCCGFKIICILDQRPYRSIDKKLHINSEELIIPQIKLEECSEWKQIIDIASKCHPVL